MADAQLVLLVVTRKPIPPGQLVLYKVLYDAGDGWVGQKELAQQTHSGSVAALNGVLRALANRVDQTSAEFKREKHGFALMIEKIAHEGEWYYRITPELRQVIDSTPHLKDTMALSIADIHAKHSKMKDWLIVDAGG
ncbi:MAG: hypothetical protein HXY40_02475 [Chloroflexi bacterium]|nr:hypothetical protein [Chloroflexota bacterium]